MYQVPNFYVFILKIVLVGKRILKSCVRSIQQFFQHYTDYDDMWSKRFVVLCNVLFTSEIRCSFLGMYILHLVIELLKCRKEQHKLMGVSKFTSFRHLFQEFKVLTIQGIFMHKIHLYGRKNFEKHIKNIFYNNYVTRRELNQCLPLHLVICWCKVNIQ